MADVVLQGAWGSAVGAAFIPFSAVVGIIFAIYQFSVVKKVIVGLTPKTNGGYRAVEDGVGDDAVMQSVADIQSAISEGEAAFFIFLCQPLKSHLQSRM